VATVEGVARLARSEIERHLTEEHATFDYGGQTIASSISACSSAAALDPAGDRHANAVILVRAGEHSTALVTDELVGSREIVVKSVGPQVASVRGISGATILGDGRIVIILDMGALVRSEWRGRAADASVRATRDERIFALVVDDSITVRRVTQRLLERNGMRVLTAKDGVDAMALLQEHVPDVILLDIEMPRMDGYEVATHVRNDPRLADVPIIMITSRVGDKHRARGDRDRRRRLPRQAVPGKRAARCDRAAGAGAAPASAVGAHDECRADELYCLLVPLAEERLLVPRACVTEVINYQAPTRWRVRRRGTWARWPGAAGACRSSRSKQPAGVRRRGPAAARASWSCRASRRSPRPPADTSPC